MSAGSIDLLGRRLLKGLDAQELPAEGMAYADRLYGAGLDYSLLSLQRIDTMLDGIRLELRPDPELMCSTAEHTNFVHTLAFYTAEVVARLLREPQEWLSYDQARKLNRHVANLGSSFENSMVCRFPTLDNQRYEYLRPLYAIRSRLVADLGAESLAASVAGFVNTNPDAPEQPLPPLLARDGLPFNVPGVLAQLPPELLAMSKMPVPEWSHGDELEQVFDFQDDLIEEGKIVWCGLVQANMLLFSPNYADGFPAEVVYDPSGTASAEQVVNAARRLSALKGVPQTDPESQVHSDRITNERVRVFGMDLPAAFGLAPLKASTIFFPPMFWPDGMLSLGHLPVVVCEKCPGVLLPLHSRFWPPELREQWLLTGDNRDGKRYNPYVLRRQAFAKGEPGALPPTRPPKPTRRERKKQAHEILARPDGYDTAVVNSLASSLYIVRDQSCIELAFALHMLAAKRGHAESQQQLGFMLEKGLGTPTPNAIDAARWYQLSAAQGEIHATYHLGTLYESGNGVPRDPKKAHELYRLAAAAGQWQAEEKLQRSGK